MMFYFMVIFLTKNADKQPFSSVKILHSVGAEDYVKGLVWLRRVRFDD